MYIYIHIPFCKTICTYCDFPKLLYTKKFSTAYLESLENEINNRYHKEEVKSIFIGGGTPTALDYDELKRLLELTTKFNKKNNVEFTIESNIESLTIDKIKLLKKYNVNRVSLGVQTFNENNLKELNRHHTKEDVFQVIAMLKSANIENISIDLIYGITPNLDIVKKDLNYFLQLDIPHISYYSLIIEDNTLFKINNRQYIDEEIEYQMYNYIEKTLTANNYLHYEISNYSKKGYQSLHNTNYWNNGSYYGFGLGAVSYLNNERIINTKNLTKYLNNNYLDKIISEDIQTQISNTIILALRTTKGLDLKKFKVTYQKDLQDIYNIDELLQENKLIIKDNYLTINKDYFYLSNEILLTFI